MNTIAYRALGGKFQNNWQSSGNQWLNPKVFVLESSHIRAGRFVLESGHKSSGRLTIRAWRYVAETYIFFLESDHICAGRFVLESARKSSRIASIRAWRFVAESEHVRGGILEHSWQKLKWLNPIRAWIRICSPSLFLPIVHLVVLDLVHTKRCSACGPKENE